MQDILEKIKEPERLDGVQAIIDYLNINPGTFYKLKSQGVFDGAIHQRGKFVMAWKDELDKAY